MYRPILEYSYTTREQIIGNTFTLHIIILNFDMTTNFILLQN